MEKKYHLISFQWLGTGGHKCTSMEAVDDIIEFIKASKKNEKGFVVLWSMELSKVDYDYIAGWAPIQCKTWGEYWDLVRKNITPVRFDHRGAAVYSDAEISKRYLPPSEPEGKKDDQENRS